LTTLFQSLTTLQPWLATQFGFETLLSALTLLLSPNSPRFPSDAAAQIYTIACDITAWLISFHRKKLGGRMASLMPLLQALLNCLFIPHAHSNPAAFSSRPPWLRSNYSAVPGGDPIGPTQARSFANVLTSLCDPTVSSVAGGRRGGNSSSSHSKHELVDETKMARAYAGEYVSVLIMEFCGLQLNGYLTAEMRKEVLPGVWAMVNCMDIEGMRVMSAGMESNGRDLWNALYAEWERFGRWKET
jgi:nucleolar pre-ribosomal-associated protein 2